MSFNQKNVPESFIVLNPEIKNKAIGIANALLDGGFEQKVSEVIALSNAKLWACYFYEKPGDRGNHVHLVPHPKGWALISGDASLIYFIFSSKNEALLKARSMAKNEKLKLYIHSLVGNIHDYESFVVNRPSPVGYSSNSKFSSRIQTKEEDSGFFIFENKRDFVRNGRWLRGEVFSRSLITKGTF